MVGPDPLTGKPKYLRETHNDRAAAEMALTRLQGQTMRWWAVRSSAVLGAKLRISPAPTKPSSLRWVW